MFFLQRLRDRLISVPDSETCHLMLPHHVLVQLKQTSQVLKASKAYEKMVELASGSPVRRPGRSRDGQSPSPPGP